MEIVGNYYGNQQNSKEENVEKNPNSEIQKSEFRMKNKIRFLMLFVIIAIAAIFILPAMVSKTKTYVGFFKEAPKIGTDSKYIVSFIIQDSLNKKSMVKYFVIEGSPKESKEMNEFIENNLDLKCFITTKKATSPGYERITDIAIK